MEHCWFKAEAVLIAPGISIPLRRYWKKHDMRTKALPLRMASIYALKLILIMLLSVSWLFVDVDRVHACSCFPIDPAEAFDRSTAVFSGEVVDSHLLYADLVDYLNISNIRRLNDIMSDPTILVLFYEFKIDVIWKGHPYEYVYLMTSSSDACGAVFQPGKKYLVYSGDGTSAYLCGSVRLESAQQHLDALGRVGQGRLPESGSRAPRPPSMSERISAEGMVARLSGSLYELLEERNSKSPTPTPTATPAPTPQFARVSDEAGAPEWLIPTVAGVAGVLIGVLTTTLTLRRRRGGT